MKTKKPFKHTFLGKVFTKDVIKSAIGEGLAFVPVAGPLLSNVFTKSLGNGANEVISEIGSLDTDRAKIQAYGVILIGTILAGVSLAMGWLTIDQIKQVVYLLMDVI